MNYVVDTHILLWLIKEPAKISKQQLQVLQNPNNQIFISNISFWEITLKYNTGKLNLQGFLPHDLPQVAVNLGLTILNIDAQTMADCYQLSQVDQHKDPFDKLLIWLCINHNYTLVSTDTQLEPYKKHNLKWI